MSMTTRLPRQLERVHFSKGDKIFREGEPGSCAYLIESGSVEISAMNHGAKITISTLGPGEIFGEMALIDNRRRSATATILEDADMIALIVRNLKARSPPQTPCCTCCCGLF